MNNTNPFVPQGSSLWEQQKMKARARLRVAVFCTLSICILGLMALLIQGCRKPSEEGAGNENTNATPVATLETPTNVVDNTATPPNTNVTPTPPVAPAMQEYTVVAGDTLSGIATKFGLSSYKAIVDANPGVEPTKLHPGQKLKIPPPAAAATTAGTTPTATSANGQDTYKVKSGDTLSSIAANHKTTVKALRAENNLTTDRITVGQILKLPKSTITTAATNAP
jgi:LysM repeat protein